jgi:hypothetical protein
MSWQPPTPNPLPPPTASPYWAPAAPPKSANVVGVIAAASAAAMCLGSFLPWATVTAGLFGTISVNGMDGDGKITLALGFVAGVLLLVGALGNNRVPVIIGTVAAGLGGAAAVYDLINVSDMVAGSSSDFVQAQVGVGLYLCAFGGVAAAVLGIVAATQIKPSGGGVV